eukprot:7025645-Karenia_brevis.AAC.1
MHRSRKAYSDAKSEVSDAKSFGVLDSDCGNASASDLKSFTAWGTEVRTDEGTAAAPLEKRAMLARVGALILSLPRAPKAILRRYLGVLVHPFMH